MASGQEAEDPMMTIDIEVKSIRYGRQSRSKPEMLHGAIHHLKSTDYNTSSAHSVVGILESF